MKRCATRALSFRAIFLPPEQSPILSFSACRAENPGALKIAPFYARNARRMARNPRKIEMAHLPVSTLLETRHRIRPTRPDSEKREAVRSDRKWLEPPNFAGRGMMLF